MAVSQTNSRRIFAYTRVGSTTSLIASVGLGSAMAVSSMRIRDGMSYGLEGAAASSAVLLVPVTRRALLTRAPIPVVTAILAAASTGYYVRELLDRQK